MLACRSGQYLYSWVFPTVRKDGPPYGTMLQPVDNSSTSDALVFALRIFQKFVRFGKTMYGRAPGTLAGRNDRPGSEIPDRVRQPRLLVTDWTHACLARNLLPRPGLILLRQYLISRWMLGARVGVYHVHERASRGNR